MQQLNHMSIADVEILRRRGADRGDLYSSLHTDRKEIETVMRQTIPVIWRSRIKRVIPPMICTLVIMALAYTIVTVLQATKCHVCQEVIIGKPERINEAPTCDRCYSEIEYNCMTTIWEDR